MTRERETPFEKSSWSAANHIAYTLSPLVSIGSNRQTLSQRQRKTLKTRKQRALDRTKKKKTKTQSSSLDLNRLQPWLPFTAMSRLHRGFRSQPTRRIRPTPVPLGTFQCTNCDTVDTAWTIQWRFSCHVRHWHHRVLRWVSLVNISSH